MLNKRTQILLDEKRWKKATNMAKSQNTSIGEVIRIALDEKWQRERELSQRREAIEHIMKIRPPVSKTPIDYKALINEGRKY